jgi:glycosyltransferase involved in cell wall biosynthesis
MDVSVVIPIYNERQNIRELHTVLSGVLPQVGAYEIIFVDDGSTDGSTSELDRLADADHHVRVIELRSNFGQSAAMSAGIHHAGGDVIVTMDGDLQNEPADIPGFVAKIHEGYDLVHGWRKQRQDRLLDRRLPSLLANALISAVTGFRVRDLGCTMKAIRRDIAREIPLHGEMHRFVPILASWRGARTVECVARHHPRRFGTSKYGISRTLRVLLDLITVKFLIKYLASPMKLFGPIGLLCAATSAVSGGLVIAMKVEAGSDMTGNPLLLLCVSSMMMAVQFIGLGLLAELGARIYYANGQREPYAIRRTRNFESATVRPIDGHSKRRAA